MKALNCLIVEDEPLAAAILRDYVGQLPGLTLAGVCGDAFSAAEMLRSQRIDLLLLDINLPKLNGLDFLRSLQARPQVILTTAYHEHALDGFNLHVADYLLKPIEFGRFLQAINKVQMLQQAMSSANAGIEPSPRKPYYFLQDKKHVKVHAEDIRYVESLKDYIRIHTMEGTVVTKYPIGEMENLLPADKFCRIHKSYLVNLDMVTAFTATDVELGKEQLPLGRTYVDHFRQRVQG
jgi:DNA-binding LytR/AlgR family response regulator